MDMLPDTDTDPVVRTQPFEPDGRMPSDFPSMSAFIASGAFDEAVLRAGKLGVERAVARDKALQQAQDACSSSTGE